MACQMRAVHSRSVTATTAEPGAAPKSERRLMLERESARARHAARAAIGRVMLASSSDSDTAGLAASYRALGDAAGRAASLLALLALEP